MKRNANIRKAARALLLLLISASHVLAMDSKGLLTDKPDTLEQLRDHGYYKTELQKLEESTRRIHEEVDRILKEFRHNMEEYRKHVRGASTTTIMPNTKILRDNGADEDLISSYVFLPGLQTVVITETGAKERKPDNQKLQLPIFEEFSVTNREGQVIAKKLQDTTSNSISVSYTKENPNVERLRRHILSLDGGGMRGIYSAAVLAIIEQIINHPVNAHASARLKKGGDKTYLDLSDIFEAMAGTSTGSIIAATLLHKNPSCRATDVLRLYVNYGYKIFDETARTTGDLIYAKYGSEGLKNLLTHYTGGDASRTLQDSVKERNHLYITALNPMDKGGTTIVFSNATPAISSQSCISYDDQSLVDVIMSSCAALTYFPEVVMEIKGEKVLLADGGFGAEFPGHLAYQEEIKHYSAHHFDLISLGTGEEPADKSNQNVTPEAGDKGITALPEIVTKLFAVATNKDILSCKDAVYDTSSRLQSIFRLQPLLEKGGTQIMDNTTRPYALGLIGKAFQLAQGEVFKRMLEYLGFTVPDEGGMEDIHRQVLRQLYSLSSEDYSKLTDLEKELLARRILDLDFDFYENCNVNNINLTEEQKGTLLAQLVSDIEKSEKNAGYLHKLKDWIYPDKKYQLIDVIKTSVAFYELSKGKGKLALEELTGTSKEKTSSMHSEFEGMVFDYEKSSALKANNDLFAAIYWKNKLSKTEGEGTVGVFNAFYNAIQTDTPQWGIWPLNNYDCPFVTALGRYVGQRFPQAK